MATISLRKGFRWLNTPSPITEPTTTTVLTSPNHLFVDIRVFHPSHPTSSSSSAPITNPRLLDWAIAGTSTSTPTGPETSHGTWNHWISSRGITVDEGDMSPDPSSGFVRELGCMLNPETGQKTPYEELWDDREQPPSAACVVLKYEDESSEEKGMCILIGHICQAVARTAAGIQVEQWTEEGEARRQVVKMGSLKTPCEEVLSGKVERKVGASWADGGREWTVVEV